MTLHSAFDERDGLFASMQASWGEPSPEIVRVDRGVCDMTAQTELVDLCKAALEQESDWRETGPEGRTAAFERFQQLLHTIADLTGRTYEDVLNDAVEEWVTVHFCSIENDIVPSAEWAAAGKAETNQQSS